MMLSTLATLAIVVASPLSVLALPGYIDHEVIRANGSTAKVDLREDFVSTPPGAPESSPTFRRSRFFAEFHSTQDQKDLCIGLLTDDKTDRESSLVSDCEVPRDFLLDTPGY